MQNRCTYALFLKMEKILHEANHLQCLYENQGNLGNLEKSGLRFSRKACLPSLASSER